MRSVRPQPKAKSQSGDGRLIGSERGAELITGTPKGGMTSQPRQRTAEETDMHVAAILKAKGRAVETVTGNVTLAEVAQRLTTHRIGAVVVCGARGDVVGIVSERDVVRMLAEHGPEALRRSASEAMTRNIETCRESDTIDELMSRMTNGRFRHIPVVENSGLAGIVSIGDVVKHHVAEVELEASAMRDYITVA
jgi:CBS domain-containing protein